jgi:hypothetical protein
MLQISDVGNLIFDFFFVNISWFYSFHSNDGTVSRVDIDLNRINSQIHEVPIS